MTPPTKTLIASDACTIINMMYFVMFSTIEKKSNDVDLLVIDNLINAYISI
jgi:hypothetical protein